MTYHDCVSLFSVGARARTSVRRYREPIFRFLDTSAWPSVERVRDFWEERFSKYGAEEQKVLAPRFQSLDNHAHLSAFLELFTFALLSRDGHYPQIEPPAGDLALDFLTRMPNSQNFYVECTATGQRAAQVGANAREAEILDAIDKVPTGRFLFGVKFDSRGKEMPPLKSLKSWLRGWLQSLESETDLKSNVQAEWISDGWTVTFTLLGQVAEDDGGGIGFIGAEASDSDEHLRLRRAIDWKASKYGALGAPLLIVTDSTQYQSKRELMTALLGDIQWRIDPARKNVTEVRLPTGVLFDQNGARNIGMSCVMHCSISVLSFADERQPPTLVHHPYAQNPLPRGLFPFCEERYFDDQSGEMVVTPPSTTLAGFFGLPSGWPFFEDDPVGD